MYYKEKNNSKFRFNELRKFGMSHVINFRIFNIINALSITDYLDNFSNSTAEHNE